MSSNDEDPLPLRERLSYKFLLSTALFIITIEAILLVLSIYGFEGRLFTLREMLAEKARTLPTITPELLLPETEIYDMAQQYALNVLLMVFVIVIAVLAGMYVVLRTWVLKPLGIILEHNSTTEEDGDPQLIPDDQIPDDELGQIMRSRNEMLQSLKNLFNEEAIEMLVGTVDAKDRYTRGHSQRVGELGRMIGQHHGLSPAQLEKLHYSGVLHDLGKIGIPDDILTADRSLTDDEFNKIQKHPDKGTEILQFRSFDDAIIDGIKHHHEEYDGNGYPSGLKGDEIPLFGRILGVADAIDAMLSNRHYRDALSVDETIEELKDNRGTQFDPELADVGIQLLENGDHEPIFEEYAGGPLQ